MAKNDAIENKYILREDIICKIFTERPIFKSMIYFFLKKERKKKGVRESGSDICMYSNRWIYQNLL